MNISMTVTVQLCAFSINNFEMFSSWSRDGWTVYASARPSGKLSGWSSFRFPHLSNKNNHVLRFSKPCLKCFLCVSYCLILIQSHSYCCFIMFHPYFLYFFDTFLLHPGVAAVLFAQHFEHRGGVQHDHGACSSAWRTKAWPTDWAKA